MKSRARKPNKPKQAPLRAYKISFDLASDDTGTGTNYQWDEQARALWLSDHRGWWSATLTPVNDNVAAMNVRPQKPLSPDELLDRIRDAFDLLIERNPHCDSKTIVQVLVVVANRKPTSDYGDAV